MGGGKHNGAGGSTPDTRADDHIEQLQTWFTQETEKELQEVTPITATMATLSAQNSRGTNDATMEMPTLHPRADAGGILHQCRQLLVKWRMHPT